MKIELNEQEYILKPKKKRTSLCIIVALLVFCVALSVVVMLGAPEPAAGDNIAVLDIVGTMSENDGYTYDQQFLLDSLDEIMADENNHGLILHIDSPGGAVYQIDELYLKIMEYKAITGRPIYAAVESYAASGGYYVACAADAIYANRNAITGSIGVIMGEFLNVGELLDKLGVEVTYIATGANKAMGNSYEPLTEEQKAIYREICEESFDQFIGVIVEGRHMDEQTVRALADGRIYTARQALQNGMIDGIESFDDTLQRMIADLGRHSMEVVTYSYSAPATLADFLAIGDPLGYFMQHNKTEERTSGLVTPKQPQVLMYYGNM